MKKLLAILLFVLVALPLSASVAKAEENTGWYISNFDSQISVLEDGRVSVKETIAVDFKNLERRGIFRYIPYIYTSKDGGKVYSKIENVLAKVDGAVAQSTVSTENEYMRVQIGDPGVFVTGFRTYSISYVVTGVLKGFTDYDELYWNATGDKWPVPILSASASVDLPKNGVLQVACYQGAYGSTEMCESEKDDPDAYFSSTRELSPGEGYTIAVGYTKGMVPLLIVENPLAMYLVIGGALAILIIWLGLFIRRKIIIQQKFSRYRKLKKTVVVEYEAPETLRPAQVGVMLDTRADTLDVSATLVDLAVRGHLTITQLLEKGKSKGYQLDKLEKDTSGLLPYEQILLSELFATSSSVALSSLSKTFYKSIEKVSVAVVADLVKREYFSASPRAAEKVCLRVVYILIGIQVVFLIAGGFWPPLYGLVAGSLVLLVIFALDVMLLSPVTTAGKEVYRKVLGFKQFLSATEKYRQPFFEGKNYFMDVLPYAMVFGVTGKLAKAFERMGYVPTQPAWLIAPSFTSFNGFTSEIKEMSNQFNSSFAAPESSGSGSGGGGFSGGGAGGGGGGSW